MTGEGRRYAAGVEIRIAAEQLAGAQLLLAAGHARIALSSTYFAAFHAARARLFAEGLEPKTHGGVQHLFNVTFVKPGRYEASVSQMLPRLQKRREEADYSTSFVVDEAMVRTELSLVREFVERMKADIEAETAAP